MSATMDMHDVLHGWEHRTWYLACEHSTRGQAKARVAWDEGELFTDLRCRRVWLVYREVTEQDAQDYWFDDWRPGDEAWLGCKRGTEGAVAWWEVTLPAAREETTP